MVQASGKASILDHPEITKSPEVTGHQGEQGSHGCGLKVDFVYSKFNGIAHANRWMDRNIIMPNLTQPGVSCIVLLDRLMSPEVTDPCTSPFPRMWLQTS